MYEVLRSRVGDRVLQAVYLAAINNNNNKSQVNLRSTWLPGLRREGEKREEG